MARGQIRFGLRQLDDEAEKGCNGPREPGEKEGFRKCAQEASTDAP